MTIDEERNRMNKDLPDIRIPHDTEYSRSVATMLRRRTMYEQLNGGYAAKHIHVIDGTPYTVCSVFSMTEKKTPEDMIRRLIDLDCGKVSAR